MKSHEARGWGNMTFDFFFAQLDEIKALEKEKEQIINAYENGVGDENERNLSGQFTNAEEYYNQTYNK
jgi:hypothetical protein